MSTRMDLSSSVEAYNHKRYLVKSAVASSPALSSSSSSGSVRMEAAAGILGGVTTSILLSTIKDDDDNDAMPKTPPSAEVSLDGDASPRMISAVPTSSSNAPTSTTSTTSSSIAKGGVPIPFPWRLHDMLDAMAQQDKGNIVSWQPHGRAFLVKDPKAFVEEVMPQYFSQTKYASFQRQLNLYGFSRLGHGRDKGAYYHACFIQNQRDLVRNMVRKKVKGTMVRKSFGPEQEPNFYDPKWQDHEYESNEQQQALLSEINTISTPPSTKASPLLTVPYTRPAVHKPILSSPPVDHEGSSSPSSHHSTKVLVRKNHNKKRRPSWEDQPPPEPKIHGFTTNVDPRLRLVVPLPQASSASTAMTNKSQPIDQSTNITCPLSRLAAIAGQLGRTDDATTA